MARLRREGHKEDSPSIRVYKRKLWVAKAYLNHNFDLETIRLVHDRYERLDLVPNHFAYPEFFRF